MANTTTTVAVTWGHGRSVLLAGTPLDSSGNIANNSSAAGILAQDLYMPDRSATIITAGTWDEYAGRASCGIALSDEAKLALNGITFVTPPVVYVTPDDLEPYAKTEDLEPYAKTEDLPVEATTSAAGLVKKAAAVADSEEESSPTTAEFNALLAALRTAGMMETPAESEN